MSLILYMSLKYYFIPRPWFWTVLYTGPGSLISLIVYMSLMLLFYPQALVLDCLIHWAGVIDELNSLYVSNVIILSPGLGSGLSYTLGGGH